MKNTIVELFVKPDSLEHVPQDYIKDRFSLPIKKFFNHNMYCMTMTTGQVPPFRCSRRPTALMGDDIVHINFSLQKRSMKSLIWHICQVWRF